MKTYTISSIKNQIESDFTSIYKNASNFPTTQLYRLTLDIICDPTELKCVIFANDLGVPPVKAVLTILSKKRLINNDITGIESQSLGSLMGFLFKQVFKYQNQRDRLTVKLFGVKTAALFLNVTDFEITEG